MKSVLVVGAIGVAAGGALTGAAGGVCTAGAGSPVVIDCVCEVYASLILP